MTAAVTRTVLADTRGWGETHLWDIALGRDHRTHPAAAAHDSCERLGGFRLADSLNSLQQGVVDSRVNFYSGTLPLKTLKLGPNPARLPALSHWSGAAPNRLWARPFRSFCAPIFVFTNLTGTHNVYVFKLMLR